MNYFFSRGISEEKGRSGKSVSVQGVKSALTEIIKEENKKKPFSDRLLAEKLEEKGFTISRRTVAKYRDCLLYTSLSAKRRADRFFLRLEECFKKNLSIRDFCSFWNFKGIGFIPERYGDDVCSA